MTLYPHITVLMSVYNGGQHLLEAVDSILRQSFKAFEFLIINDGCTDNSAEILSSFADSRIRLIENERNLGLSASLNRGFAEARGTYIARMDADDISLPNRLQVQFEFMEKNPDIDVCGTNYSLVGNEKSISCMAKDHKSITSKMLFYNSIAHPTVFIRRKTIKKQNLRYNEKFMYAQDYELWCKNLNNLKFANIQQVLLKYRHHDNNIGKIKQEEQIKYADDVRIFNLKNYLKIELFDKEISLHNKIFRYPEKEFANVKAALAWLNYLKKRAEKFGYNSDFLYKKIIIYQRRRFYFFRKIFFLLCRIKNKLSTKRSGLKTLILLMRNKCNAKCIMCGLDYYGNRTDKEITFEKALKIFANINTGGLKNLVFSGGGEPLLAKDFIQIVEYVNSRYPDIKLSIYTNGITMSGEKAEIIAKRFNRVTVSINAATEDVYKKLMGVDMFNNVVSNIKNLSKLKLKYNPKLEIDLSFVASVLNIDELPSLIMQAKEMGANSVTMQYCRFYSLKIGLDADCVMDKRYSLFYEQEKSDKILEVAKKNAQTEGISFRCEQLFKETVISPQNCGYPLNMILVDPEGYVFPCGGGEVMFHNAVHSDKKNFGNIFEMSIKKIFNLPDVKNIFYNSNISYEKRCLAQCKNCNHTIKLLGAKDKMSHFIDIE